MLLNINKLILIKQSIKKVCNLYLNKFYEENNQQNSN